MSLAQTIAPRAVVPAGAHGTGSTFTLGWTLGQVSSATFTSPGAILTAGVQQPEGVVLGLNIRVLLDGPFREPTALMHDSLRVRGLLPSTEPYSALGLPSVGMSNVPSIAPGALAVQGPNALVDWVYVELRDAGDPTLVVAARAAVVQRDGDVVHSDGVSPLRISALPGAYHIAVRHRNHLGAMTFAAIPLSTPPTTVDLISGSIATFGTEAQRVRAGVRLLWSGDTNADGVARYTGQDNDREPILVQIGGTVPTAITSGYLPTDLNLDGTIRYTGQDNDRDIILVTVGGSVPTAVRLEQLP